MSAARSLPMFPTQIESERITRHAMDFDGVTYQRQHDGARLAEQLQHVFDAMKDARWQTLDEIQSRILAAMKAQHPDAPAVPMKETSLSARVRDFRKPKFGGHQVERRRRGDASLGIFEYRLLINK